MRGFSSPCIIHIEKRSTACCKAYEISFLTTCKFSTQILNFLILWSSRINCRTVASLICLFGSCESVQKLVQDHKNFGSCNEIYEEVA